MSRIVFLLEEASMREVLEVILPKILPSDVGFLTIPHQGKQDLEKSIPRKLKGWNVPGDRFVVVRDKDAGDCVVIKNNLREICELAGKTDVLIRIVCHELEAWYLGDWRAVAEAYEKPTLADLQKKTIFRKPDNRVSPLTDILRKVPEYQKVSGSQKIAPHLNLENNLSHSFQVFLSGVQKLAQTMSEGIPAP